MPLDQTGVSKDAEMMGGVGLRTVQFPHQIRHAFFTDEQGLQDTQPRFVAQGLRTEAHWRGVNVLVCKGAFISSSFPGRESR